MALTETPPQTTQPTTSESSEPVAPPRSEPTLVERLVGSGDHQLIGRMFIVVSLLLGAASLVVGGLRDLDVASNAKIFLPEVSNRLLLNSPLGLLLLGILPLFIGIAFCVVPKQLGSPAIAFHRAASASFWGWLGSAILFVVAVSANGSYGGLDSKMARLGNVATGGLMVSIMLASVSIAVTVLSLRPAGMTLDRVPFFSFSMFVASTVWILTLPAAAAYVLIGQISHANAETLFTSSPLGQSSYAGLSFILIQPAIYAVFIPVLGILLDVAATAVGGRQRFRGVQLGLIAAFGLFSYGAWTQGHVGQSNFIWAGFCLAVFLPLVLVFGGAGDTLRRGRPKFMSPLAFSVLAVLLALLAVGDGGIQVINTSGKGYLTSFDRFSLASGQFRLIVGAAIVGALGALFYWGRQIFGLSLPDIAGKGLAPLAALAVIVWGIPPVIAGIAKGGSARPMAGIAAAGAALVALVVLAVLGAGLQAVRTSLRGDVLAPDHWGGGGTLEWTDLDQPTVASAYPALDGPGGGAS